MRRPTTNEQRASSLGHRATILLSLFLLAAVSATAQTAIITTVAGSGDVIADGRGGFIVIGAFSGDGGPATGASLNFPRGVAVDASGNLFIADSLNLRVRRVDAATGIITTVAGNGIFGFSGDGGPATSASLSFSNGLAVDAAGNLYIADEFNQRIRRVILEEPNQPPVADAGPDQRLECTSPGASSVTLDGSASSDPDGDPLTFLWTLPGGSTATGVNPTVSLPLGTHTFTLVVNDGVVDSPPDSVNITVKVGVVGLQPPLAALAPEGQGALVPDHAFKQGRTLPLKLQLFCGMTALTDADVSPPRIVALFRAGDAIDLTTIDPDAGEANDSGLLFRYSAPNWVYNLGTQGLSAGTYLITVAMPDGLRYTAAFVLR